MELSKFKGEYVAWESFRQLFKKMIDNQASLSDFEKLAYLKGQLEGEPKTLIAALPILNESYQILECQSIAWILHCFKK